MRFVGEEGGTGDWTEEARRDETRPVYCGSKKRLKGGVKGVENFVDGRSDRARRCACLVELTVCSFTNGIRTCV